MLLKLLSASFFFLITATLMASSIKTQSNVPAEVVFHASGKHADPFNDVTMDVIFSDPDGGSHRVPAFWDGGDVWKVRYASPQTGAHPYVTECREDPGLNGVHGTIDVTAYKGSNPLFKHGPIQIAPDKRHLQHPDGKPFFWLGDTWWMGLAKRLQWPDEFMALAADRVHKGFNVVQIVAGLYPDMPPFDPRGINEAGFPGDKDFKNVNPAYFDKADERLSYLVSQGIVPCIVGSWGYYATWMNLDRLEHHWRNLIARYGAMPVVWCGCGEVDMPWYPQDRKEYSRKDRMATWTEVSRYIHQTDPFHRLLTLHPDGASARDTINDPSLLDFDMLQSGHGLADGARGAAKASAYTYAASPQMPFIDGESSYENLGNSIPAYWTRATFWISMLNGAAGHTYGANGIWQNNRPGDPHGASPMGNNWGTMPSSEAMHLPGSTQEAMGKRLFEKYQWQSFRPHPEWVSYQVGEKATLQGSKWIWYPEGNPAVDAPLAARYFRAEFNLPQNKTVSDARLLFSADDAAVAYLNGVKLGEAGSWKSAKALSGLAGRLRPYANVLAIRAENLAANVTQNPAGLIAMLEVRFADGSSKVVRSDSSWMTSTAELGGWNQVDFNPLGWRAAVAMGPLGMLPWGDIDAGGYGVAPQAAGNPDVRILFMLEPKAITLHGLDSAKVWRAKLFDPESGKTVSLGSVKPDGSGNGSVSPPKGWDHDWVLVLEPSAAKVEQSQFQMSILCLRFRQIQSRSKKLPFVRNSLTPDSYLIGPFREGKWLDLCGFPSCAAQHDLGSFGY